MLLYAFTIFTSAFLLFAVQPMIAKAILPWFGGAAAVWTTCMLFFQTVLLLGYLYAHFSIRFLKPRMQGITHGVLLLSALVLLPIAPSQSWKPTGGEEPLFRILSLLAISVGLPYFLLSTTGPLLQAWCARQLKIAFPYRLYALSNVGSMLALLSYPVAVEQALRIRTQLNSWSIVFVAFAIMCGTLALKNVFGKAAQAASEDGASEVETGPSPSVGTYLRWLLFAAIPSVMLLAVTNYLCQNVAAIPFLWVLPLSLYLLTFIICFDKPEWYSRRIYLWVLAVALGLLTVGLLKVNANASLVLLIPIFSIGFFLCCMFCHGELASRRPDARHLTAFYLMVSVGGAFGSILVGIVAPYLFRGYFELPIAVAICGLMALFMLYGKDWRTDVAWAAICIALTVGAVQGIRMFTSGSRVMMRNFYGSLRVVDHDGARLLVHGVINHGVQILDPDKRRNPTSYFGPQSGAARAIEFSRHSSVKIGILGLGAGALAVYAKPGDLFRFYEINPDVIQLANDEFTFLKECEGDVEVVLGDGRLSLEREDPQNFDALVMDAFSGDSIPVHLVTREAMQLYFRHLKPDGVLALNISNTYLDLIPVVRALADNLGKQSRLIVTPREPEKKLFLSVWMVVTSNQDFLERAGLKQDDRRPDPRQIGLWTDDYSNQFQILK